MEKSGGFIASKENQKWVSNYKSLCWFQSPARKWNLSYFIIREGLEEFHKVQHSSLLNVSHTVDFAPLSTQFSVERAINSEGDG